MMISRNLYGALACLCMLVNMIAARQLPQPERRTNGGIRGEKSAQLDGGIRELKKGQKGPCGMNTCHPTATPSLQPSSEPSVSQAPSPSPSDQPSPAPSTSPTSAPSPAPSTSPTQAPSPSPSDQPSPIPSTSPSSAPSPTPSTSPAPSSNPSAQPSRTPSSNPSLAPSVSAAPSPQIWDLRTVDGYDNSTCIVLPPKLINSRTVLSSLDYQYFMYLTDDSEIDQAQVMANDLEPKLHLALAREALTCDYLPGLDFFLVGLSAANEETVLGRCPDQSQSCWDVQGSIQVQVYYFSGNRRLNEAALIAKYIEIAEAAFATLVDGVTLFDIKLQGFTNANVLDTTIYTGVDDPNYQGFESIPSNPSSDDGFRFGPPIIGLAVAAFVVLVGLLAWRGRRRREAYLKHLEEVDGLSLEESVKEAMDRRDFVVQEDDGDDGDEDSSEKTFQRIRNEEVQDHDFRKCTAVTCRICSEGAQQPIFIATELESIEADFKAELGPQRYSSRGHGLVNDTVML